MTKLTRRTILKAGLATRAAALITMGVPRQPGYVSSEFIYETAPFPCPC
jgi:hypothetical protein